MLLAQLGHLLSVLEFAVTWQGTPGSGIIDTRGVVHYQKLPLKVCAWTLGGIVEDNAMI